MFALNKARGIRQGQGQESIRTLIDFFANGEIRFRAIARLVAKLRRSIQDLLDGRIIIVKHPVVFAEHILLVFCFIYNS